MSTTPATERHDPDEPPRLSWRTALTALILYGIALVAATWPFVKTFADRLPSVGDPSQHLWVMRWYKASLLAGRSPLVCPELQYPVGAPIGNFSPLHLQSLLYAVVSTFTANDVLCYNVVWACGFLLTGMGTFALARHVLRDDQGAFLAGLLTMISGPAMIHSHVHTELIYVGGFPLFFLAWMRFVDRPGVRRLLAAIGGFALVSMCAAYFMVFAIFPAALYVAWKGARSGRGERIRWLGMRAGWLAGFAAGVMPVLGLLFAGQIRNMIVGEAVHRPRIEFDHYGAPWWSYLVPSPSFRLSGLLPFDPFDAAGVSGEGMAYLGVVALLLVHRAGVKRVAFRDAGFWWAAAALMVVLSLGTAIPFGNNKIPMPAGWLRDREWFVPFQLIRVPARFKLLVPVCTGIIAGAAWSQWRVRRPPWLGRLALLAVASLAVLDLGHVPYNAEPLPAPPEAYAWLLDRDPEAAWVEVPQPTSSDAESLFAEMTYWQSIHGGRTTSGYSGHPNRPFDDRLAWASPFASRRLTEASYPAEGHVERFDVVTEAGFLDYAWLYLERNGLRYVVLHHRAEDLGYRLERIAALLEDARIYDDGTVAIYDRLKIRRPTAPVPLCGEGWGTLGLLPRDGFVRLVGPDVAIDYYNPDPDMPLVLAVRARALGRNRRVRVLAGDEVVADWQFGPKEPAIQATRPFRASEGLGRLRIESDGEAPADLVRSNFDGNNGPVSLIVSGVCLRPAEAAPERPKRMIASEPGEVSETVR